MLVDKYEKVYGVVRVFEKKRFDLGKEIREVFFKEMVGRLRLEGWVGVN